MTDNTAPNHTTESTPRPWHALDAAETLRALHVDPDTGLSPDEATARLAKHGPNQLPKPRQRTPLARFLAQFNNILIYVLIGAAVVTAFLQNWVDTGVILAVVVINAIIGFLQEGKAEKALAAIREMLSLNATVLRSGERRQIPAEQLVPGDIVLLQSGDKIPADLRLIRVKSLRVEEAPLTGESTSVEKNTDPTAAETVLGDRVSMAFSGTLVSYGQATGIVVATGARTEIGKINAMLAAAPTLKTPLLKQTDLFGKWLTVAILALAALTFAFGLIARDYTWDELFLAVVGLAVAAIPEGLPAILTITLALGVQRMAARRAIIRRLPAVETVGAVTVICTDKTGTLTRNEMTVSSIVSGRHLYTVTGAGYEPEGNFLRETEPVNPTETPHLLDLVRAAFLCNDSRLRHSENRWTIEGDPTEGALLSLGRKAGRREENEAAEFPRLDSIPFESEHKYMATLHRGPAENLLLVKGAPERLLSFCQSQRTPDGEEPLDPDFWQKSIERLAANGQRLLAVARKKLPSSQTEISHEDAQTGLVFLGLLGLIDPPRDEAVAAIADCHRAGIRVKMITGDHALTAKSIGRQVGIGGERVLTGADLETMSDDDLRRTAPEVDVFARTSPEHKLRLVKALRAEGHVVAMTGDGVNDAPALQSADIGIAMGIKGTEAAKEAAEMVLTDDNFASIVHAVEEGRTVYNNLKKAILFILPTNGGQALVIVLALLFGLTLPITPVQILWVNMICAVTLALALGFEPAEQDVMSRPPRDPKEPLLPPFFLWRIAFVSLLLAAGSLGMFYWAGHTGATLAEARTMAVNALIAGQVFYLFNSRYLHRSVLSLRGLFGNPFVLYAAATILLAQLVFTYLPLMQTWFGSASISLTGWLATTLYGLALFLIVETEKTLVRRITSRRARPNPSTTTPH